MDVYDNFGGGAALRAERSVAAGGGAVLEGTSEPELVEAALPGQKSGIRQEAAATLEGSRKEIALTFDDGPHPVYTKLLLDGLRERGVKATFFLIGQNLDGNEKLVRQMKGGWPSDRKSQPEAYAADCRSREGCLQPDPMDQ